MDNTEINSGNALALPVGYELQKRYKIGKVLGAGGFGITYKAYDVMNQSFCAIKEYVPLGICMREPDRVMLIPARVDLRDSFLHGRDRFMEEAAVLLEVSEIPNIVRITDYFEGNGTAYYVMEYLEGSTIRQLQKVMPGKRIPFVEALRILNVIGKALDRVHSRKLLLHRDISPDNIFCTVDEKIKLIDFGSAKHISRQGNQNFSVVLKPRFAPPEQYRSDSKQGCYTDVYALASTFYYMISGQMMPDAMERVAGAEYTPAWKIVPEMTRQMSAVLDKALQTDCRKRYQTVGQFLSELEAARRDAVDSVASVNFAVEGVKPESVAKDGERPVIIWREMEGEKKKWFIPADVMLRVGRTEGQSQLVIGTHPEISKLHCFVQYDRENKKYLVKDVSTNGTRAGQETLQKNQVYAFAVGTRLKLAGVCEIELGVENGKKRTPG